MTNFILLLSDKMLCSIFLCLLFCASVIYSRNIFYFDNVIFGNLKRREVIPLSQINNPSGYNRRSFRRNNYMEPTYRKSKDIRAPSAAYMYEMTEPKMREPADKKEDGDGQNEFRWLTIGADESLDHHPGLMYIGPQ